MKEPVINDDLSDEAMAAAHGEVARDDGKTAGWAPNKHREAWLRGWAKADRHRKAMGLPPASVPPIRWEPPCPACGGSGEGPDRHDGEGNVYQGTCAECGGTGAMRPVMLETKP